MTPEDPLAPPGDPFEIAPDPIADVNTRRQSELRLRIMSAAVMAVIVVGLAYAGGLPFRVLSVVVGLVVLQEWSAMTGCLRPFGFAQGFTVVSMIVVSVLVLMGNYSGALVTSLIAFLAALVISFVRLRTASRAQEARHWSWLSMGFLYATGIMVAFATLRGDSAFGLAACAFILAVVWATDIFAYFVGKSLGGPKLAPSISPNKTWSGFFGGVLFAVLAGAAVLGAYVWKGVLPGNVWWFVAVAVLLSIVSQCGDLFESWVKRRSGAKDSGRIIPGHGGLMDRIDGLGAAAVAALALLVFTTGGTDMNDALFAALDRR